jgi:hypothetical protein
LLSNKSEMIVLDHRDIKNSSGNKKGKDNKKRKNSMEPDDDQNFRFKTPVVANAVEETAEVPVRGKSISGVNVRRVSMSLIAAPSIEQIRLSSSFDL